MILLCSSISSLINSTTTTTYSATQLSRTMSKITVEEQKRMNSVLQQNCLISKPDKPNDKSQQTGRHQTVTRGHPDFCVLCGTRHSMIACPLLDPVAETEPSPSTHNPENQRIQKPSRCKDCVVVENRAEYVDGYKITTKKTKLCSRHLPASAPTYPASAPTFLDMDTQLDLDAVLPELGPDIMAVLDMNPYSLLDLIPPAPAPTVIPATTPTVAQATAAPTFPAAFPAVSSTSPLADADPTSPLTAADTTSPLAAADPNFSPAAADPASPRAAAAPMKRRYIRRGGDYSQLHEDYKKILRNFQATSNLQAACKQAGMGRTTFFQKRHISELELVDPAIYKQLKQRADMEKKTVKDFSKRCKEKLNESPFKQQLKALKQEGKLLP